MRLVLGADGEDGSQIPSEIGPYSILRQIGEGGMGEVFLAEQHEPIQRQVALKVIKPGMDTRRVVKRFEAERQALALMDHGSIAKVFDAGATPSGRPYFVMEYVRGEPITDYADRMKLTLPQRLDLFGKVCAGVQHALQKGVIHRDLKPSNVLVTEQDGEANPKIIDFGVAKAISKRLTEQTLYTELGIMIGTPEYMSPEQAEVSVLDIDTRSDVYSLGVILYELLTGALPFEPAELRRAGHEEIRRKIREEEPATPSSRVSTLGQRATDAAGARRIEPSGLRRALEGDLDWIVLHALAKERDRRYGSPAEFAADVTRYLNDEPIVARPPSAGYKARKFVHRNKLLVASVGVVLLSLLAGIAGTTTFGLREARQRKATAAALSDLEQVVGFQQSMLSDIELEEMGQELVDLLSRLADDQSAEAMQQALSGINATDAARAVLDEQILGRAVEAVGRRFGDQPAVEARLRSSIGRTYNKLGLMNQSAEQLRRSVEIFRETVGLRTGQAIAALRGLGLTYSQQGRFKDAEPILEEALELSRDVLGENHRDTALTMSNLGLLYHRTARFEESAKIHEAALVILREVDGPDSVRTLSTMTALADSLDELGRFDEAEERYREIIDGLQRVWGVDSAERLTARANLAICIMQQGRLEEAEELFRSTLDDLQRVLGATHILTIQLSMNLAGIYLNAGDMPGAETLYRGLLEGMEERGNAQTHMGLVARLNLGISISNQKRYLDAAVELGTAYDGMQEMLGPCHPQTVLALMLLDQSYWQGDQNGPGRETARQIVEVAREDPSCVSGAQLQIILARKLLFWDVDLGLRDPEWALKLAIEANELSGYANADHLGILARARFETGDVEAAIEHQTKALSMLEAGSALRSEYEATLAEYQER